MRTVAGLSPKFTGGEWAGGALPINYPATEIDDMPFGQSPYGNGYLLPKEPLPGDSTKGQ
jgi:hypothetical protein